MPGTSELTLLNAAIGVAVAIPCAITAAWGLSGADKARQGLGAGAVAVLVGLLVSAGAYAVYLDQQRQVKAGWNLLPVVVAADRLEAGTVLTYDMISQRPVPEQYVTDSIVRPDRAPEVVGQKLVGPVQAGDPLTWVLFGKGLAPEACARAGAAHAR